MKNTPWPLLGDDLRRHLLYSLGRDEESATPKDYFLPLCLSVRDRLLEAMILTERRHRQSGAKRVYYLSMEFLPGRSLANHLYSLGLFGACRSALGEMGMVLEDLLEEEGDAPFGNGGLGRLAACFLDSMATLGLAGQGYGLHYEYGLFRQEIDNGYQKEKPDAQPSRQSPWEIERPDEACLVPLYGRIEHGRDRWGGYNPMWVDWSVLIGVPYDRPVSGYGGHTVNPLRLYAARASSEFDVTIFNEGDYVRAVEEKIAAETVSKILYPSDTVASGRELRLVQEYFLVACALRDMVRQHLRRHGDIKTFPRYAAVQMNDTHPSLAVAELMRLFVDEFELPWERSWDMTVASLSYTNHTLLSEALEKWPVSLLERVLPRHLQIIYEINRRFLERVALRWPGNEERQRRMSLIEEGEDKKVRMAHLAVAGSHAVNGVSVLHSELVRKELVPDFFSLWPDRFLNVTNGVTQRRWLLQANPDLADLISQAVGPKWIVSLDALADLAGFAEDRPFQDALARVKRNNKERLCRFVAKATGLSPDPESLFDVQAKRIHEYKRQLLKLLHIIHEYVMFAEEGRAPAVARTFLFAGKAAPGYWQARQIIKLIHSVAETLRRDSRVNPWLKVVFLPDYRVSLAEVLIPAADLSEQISTAGTEASGTGNMKFALNGALTVGTLDGANIEIREAVGNENFYAFGLSASAVQRMRAEGSYRPEELYAKDPVIRRVMDVFKGDRFCPGEPGLFRWVYERLLTEGDPFFHLADFRDYLAASDRVLKDFLDPSLWHARVVRNLAGMGPFSSDRAVAEYARTIWGIGG